MSQFSDLLTEGMIFLISKMDAPTLTHNGVTAKVISTPIAKSQKLAETGYWLAYRCVCEMLREDFTRLAILDRSVVTYTEGDGGARSIKAKVIGIEGLESDGDPCVRVTLEEVAANVKEER